MNARQDQTQVAVFDFDGTLIDGQSGALFTVYLFRRRLMGLARAARLGWWGARYKFHLPYRQDEAREVVFGALRELSTEDADAVMRAFYREVLAPRYRPQTLEAVRARKEEGCVTLLVSATFDVIARCAAEELGLTDTLATRMARDAQDHYTGEVDGPVVAGPQKYRSVEAWCDEHLGQGAWRLAYAYADHYSDRDLLGRADHAFAVCPGKTLRPVAKREGWTICDWER